ncbi:MAG TPA: hypothetical protein VFJ50_01630, partial [Gemmatimonadales bacterium]|nr:hypothetical protein [Gemmatimonadales bacterium]
MISTLALFFAVGGASAYAINEWTGANIQDETLTGADVKGKNGTSTAKGVNGTLTGADISGQPSIAAVGQPFVNGSLNTYDISDGGLRSQDFPTDALTGTQIKESTLGKVPDADKLDGLDGAQFGRVIGFGADSAFGNLSNPNSNVTFAPSFTPSASGRCLVTVSTQVFSG